jgi:hypothetical protein
MKIIITESQLDNVVYEFLDGEYYPDYGWEPYFYRDEIKQWGTVTFYINDIEGYYYYEGGNGTLEVNPWVCKDLDIWFSYGWKIPFKKWFEKNSGLEVSAMVTNGRWVNFN